jgi:uncharacterized protein (TIGR03435 family)
MKRLACALLIALPTLAQSFEVTSVKPHKPLGGGFQGVQPACKDGRFLAITPLFITMQWAYNLSFQQYQEFRAKLPEWAQTIAGSYDLEASTQPGVTEVQCKQMAQHLFEDRFHFKYHIETITAKVFELVPARGGFKMPPADDSPGYSVTDNGQVVQPAPGQEIPKGVTMDDLARWLSGRTPDNTPVINKTGIQGTYKFKIAFSIGLAANREFADPEIFTALEQQLGLKLQEARGPVAHFVVDSIEKPDPN